VRISHERRNVELKARDPDPGRSLAACAALGAEDAGVLAQRDTYFHAARGRLKLREEEGAPALLIAYARADAAAARESAYRLVGVPRPGELREALAATLGVAAVVAKRRHLHLWRNVRIHLDEVEGLGSFVELEAVVASGSDLARERELVRQLRERLAIEEASLVAESYCDLVAAGSQAGAGPGGGGAGGSPRSGGGATAGSPLTAVRRK